MAPEQHAGLLGLEPLTQLAVVGMEVVGSDVEAVGGAVDAYEGLNVVGSDDEEELGDDERDCAEMVGVLLGAMEGDAVVRTVLQPAATNAGPTAAKEAAASAANVTVTLALHVPPVNAVELTDVKTLELTKMAVIGTIW